jgi:hypothetical protein
MILEFTDRVRSSSVYGGSFIHLASKIRIKTCNSELRYGSGSFIFIKIKRISEKNLNCWVVDKRNITKKRTL